MNGTNNFTRHKRAREEDPNPLHNRSPACSTGGRQDASEVVFSPHDLDDIRTIALTNGCVGLLCVRPFLISQKIVYFAPSHSCVTNILIFLRHRFVPVFLVTS
jgi:hypothetical protein